MPTRLQRFEAKFIPEPNSGCWLWFGSTGPTGYGNFWNGEAIEGAHRFSYRAYVGPILLPQLDHLCRVRCCVNPAHLEPVTCSENLYRGDMGRYGDSNRNGIKTVCPKGHPYAGGNLYVRPDGSRECKHCLRDKQRWRRMCNGIPIREHPEYDWSK